MPDLLLELFSEEIPARMQRQAAEDLKRLVTDALVARNLLYEGAQSFVTPRRLTLHVVGLPAAQAHSREERKGPRVGAPEAAIQGFLKGAGLKRIEDARVETDPKKGQFYVAVIEKPGRETKDAIAEIIPAIIRCVSVAEIDALGRGLREAGRAPLGAPVARHRVHARHSTRYGGDRLIRDRRDCGRRRDLGPPLHGASADSCPPLRRLC